MSKKTWQKMLSMILAAIMVLSLVACGQPANSKTTEAPEQSTKAPEQQTPEATDAPTEAEPELTYPLDTDIEITWWSQGDIKYKSKFTSADESPFHIGLAKNTGVKINWKFPQDGISSSQAYNLLWTEEKVENLPHIIHYNHNAADIEMLIEDGVVWDLTEYLPKYAPDYWEYVQSDPTFKAATRTASGKYFWFLGGCEDWYNITYMGPVVRKDWLDECGLQVPTTIEEFENMLVKFKEKYGAVYSAAKAFGLASGSGAFADNAATWYVDDNGVVQFANTTPEFKAHLETMRRWYELGILDPDLFTNSAKSVRTKAVNGLTGAAYVPSSNFRNFLVDEETSGANWIGIPNLVDKNGDVTWLQTRKSLMGSKGCIITKAASEEELIVALKLLNYAYTKDGFMYWNFGDEGVTYTFDAEGKVQWTDLITKDEAGAETAYKYYTSSGPIIQAKEQIELLNKGKSHEAILAWIENTEVANKHFMPAVVFTDAESAAYVDPFSNITDYVAECVQKFVLGEMSFDEWDNYCKTLSGMGLEACRQARQAAYDRWADVAYGE